VTEGKESASARYLVAGGLFHLMLVKYALLL